MNKKTTLVEKYLRVLYLHPKTLFLLGLLVVTVLGYGLKNLKADFSFRLLNSHDDHKLTTYDLYERNFGNDDSVAVFIHNPNGVFNAESFKFLHDLEAKIQLLPDTFRIESLLSGSVINSIDDTIEISGLVNPQEIHKYGANDYNILKQTALNSPQFAGSLVSKDATVALINAYLPPTKYFTVDFYKYAKAIEDIVAATAKPDDIKVHYSGTVYLQKTMIEVSRKDQRTLFPIIVLLFSIIAYISFRSLVGVALLIFVIGVNILCSLGLQGHLDYPINGFTSSIPIIITTITTGGLIHLLVGFYRTYLSTGDKLSSLIKAYSHTFIPILFTSLTTAVGFFSLANKDLMPVYQLGITIGAATLVSWFILMTILGPMLHFIYKQRKVVDLDSTGLPIFNHDQDKEANAFSKSYVRFISKYKNIIIISWIVAVALSCLAIPTLRITMNPFNQYSSQHPIVETTKLLKEKMGFTVFTEMMIDTGKADGASDIGLLKRMEQFEEALLKKEGLSQNISVISLLKEMHKILNENDPTKHVLPDTDQAIAQYLLLYSLSNNNKIKNFISDDRRYIKSTAFTSLEESDLILEQMDRIEALAKTYNLNLQVTGKMPLFMGLGLKVFSVIGTSALISLFCILIIMFLLIRNFKLGILSMIPNVLPIILGASVLKFLGFGIDISSTLIFSVCLGVAVDDTIHFIHHWLKLKKLGKEPEEILAHIVVNLFPMIIATTVLLSVGFSVLAFGYFLPTVKFGILCACVLTLAMLADLLLLPAILLKRKILD